MQCNDADNKNISSQNFILIEQTLKHVINLFIMRFLMLPHHYQTDGMNIVYNKLTTCCFKSVAGKLLHTSATFSIFTPFRKYSAPRQNQAFFVRPRPAEVAMVTELSYILPQSLGTLSRRLFCHPQPSFNSQLR